MENATEFDRIPGDATIGGTPVESLTALPGDGSAATGGEPPVTEPWVSEEERERRMPETLEPGRLLLKGESEELKQLNKLNKGVGIIGTLFGVIGILLLFPQVSDALPLDICCQITFTFLGIFLLGFRRRSRILSRSW